MFEIILSGLAILFILYLGRTGATFGLFFELTSTLLLFFAMMVALRFWYPLTEWTSAEFPATKGISAAFVGYWILFLIGSVPLLLVMKLVQEGAQPKYPNALDSVLGFVFGICSAAILICSVMTSLSVVLPRLVDSYDPNSLLLRLDTAPIAVYEYIERDQLQIDEKNPTHTRLPSLDADEIRKADPEHFTIFWH